MSKLTTKKQQLQVLQLKDIVISTTNPRKIYDFKALEELTSSIKQNGVIQPILVREKKGKFELVCGERRYRASIKAELTEIPCYIKELTDTQVLEIQLIENLEREDVHPLHEAKAIQNLIISTDYKIIDVANKLGKSESFIVKRLQLVNLIEQWQDLFLSNNTIKLSHALLIASQIPQVQIDLLNTAFDFNDTILTVKNLDNHIDRNYHYDLSKAIFSTTDETILEKENSSCISCNKRTNANTLLFDNVELKDKCLDAKCFNLKTQITGFLNVKTVIESGEDIFFLTNNNNSTPTKIEQLINDYKIKTYKIYNDFYKNENSELKGIWIDGSEIGKIINISLYEFSDGTVKKKLADCTPDEKIQKLKKREKRAKELDAEKIQKKIVASIEEHNVITNNIISKEEIDIVLERYMIISNANWHISNELYKELKLTAFTKQNSKVETKFKQLLNLTKEQMIYATRIIAFDNYKRHNPNYDTGYFVRKLAEQYKEVPISDIEKEQKEIATKRQKRVKERLNELKKK